MKAIQPKPVITSGQMQALFTKLDIRVIPTAKGRGDDRKLRSTGECAVRPLVFDEAGFNGLVQQYEKNGMNIYVHFDTTTQTGLDADGFETAQQAEASGERTATAIQNIIDDKTIAKPVVFIDMLGKKEQGHKMMFLIKETGHVLLPVYYSEIQMDQGRFHALSEHFNAGVNKPKFLYGHENNKDNQYIQMTEGCNSLQLQMLDDLRKDSGDVSEKAKGNRFPLTLKCLKYTQGNLEQIIKDMRALFGEDVFNEEELAKLTARHEQRKARTEDKDDARANSFSLLYLALKDHVRSDERKLQQVKDEFAKYFPKL